MSKKSNPSIKFTKSVKQIPNKASEKFGELKSMLGVEKDDHQYSEEKLIIALNRLRKEVKRQGSLKRRFIGGLISGLGTVIGATLLVSILLFLLSQLSTIEFLRPFVKDIVSIVEEN